MPTGDPLAPAAPSLDLAVFPTLRRITVVGGDLAIGEYRDYDGIRVGVRWAF